MYELKVIVNVKGDLNTKVVSTDPADIDRTLIEWLDEMIWEYASNNPAAWKESNIESVMFEPMPKKEK